MDQLSDITQFIGRFHIVLLHLPIGLLLLVGVLELLSLNPKWHHATSSTRFILSVAAPVAVLAAVCGWLLAVGGGYDERMLFLHRWTGVAVAVASCVILLFHSRGWMSLYRVGVGIATILTLAAGHFGGALTHGSGYLTRYAPAWLGGQPSEAASEGDKIAEPLSYAGVEPIFSEYCFSCHGEEKSKAGLRVDSLEYLIAGGDSGPAFVPGNETESLLLSRMLLPPDHEDLMPPEGKPQLSLAEIEQVRAWVASEDSD